MGLTQTVAPAREPVTIWDLKRQCRLEATDTDEDELLETYIKAARERVEGDTGRQLITASWRLDLDEFPEDETELDYPPLISITSITYIDTSTVTQTVSSAIYEADTTVEPGRIRLKYDQSWPSDLRGHANDVKITYTAGYGTTPSTVPASIRSAILLLAAHWFMNREPVALGTIVTNIPMSYESLVWSKRMRGMK